MDTPRVCVKHFTLSPPSRDCASYGVWSSMLSFDAELEGTRGGALRLPTQRPNPGNSSKSAAVTV